MAILYSTSTADNLNDLQTAVNAVLAPLTSHFIRGINFAVLSKARSFGQELAVIVSYETGGAPIATPYLWTAFAGRTISEAVTSASTNSSANPTYWFSPLQIVRFDRTGFIRPNLAGYLYNTNLANGELNWAPGGTGGGGSSGSPVTVAVGAGTTTLDTLDVNSIRAADYFIVIQKGAVSQTFNTHISNNKIKAGADATNANIVAWGGLTDLTGGTMDVTITTSLTGAGAAQRQLLQATSSSAGWTVVFIGRYAELTA